jgi:hypothetical protein
MLIFSSLLIFANIKILKQQIIMNILFDQRLKEITQEHETLLKRKNEPIIPGNGIYTRYKYPVLTAMHTPLMRRYSREKTTPSRQEEK